MLGLHFGKNAMLQASGGRRAPNDPDVQVYLGLGDAPSGAKPRVALVGDSAPGGPVYAFTRSRGSVGLGDRRHPGTLLTAFCEGGKEGR
jgi:hypothetical protein